MKFSAFFLGGALLGISGAIGDYFGIFPKGGDLSGEILSSLDGSLSTEKTNQSSPQSSSSSSSSSTSSTTTSGGGTKGEVFAVKSSGGRLVVKVDDNFLKQNLTTDVYGKVTELLKTEGKFFISRDYGSGRWIYQEQNQDGYKSFNVHPHLYSG